MFYRTRVMVAAADFLHGADLLRKGDTFVATPIDADYLHSHGRATFAPEPQAAPKVEAAATAPVPASAPTAAPAPTPAPAEEKIETPDAASTEASAAGPESLQATGSPESSDAGAANAPRETAAPSAEAPAPAPATGRRRRAAQNSASE